MWPSVCYSSQNVRIGDSLFLGRGRDVDWVHSPGYSPVSDTSVHSSLGLVTVIYRPIRSSPATTLSGSLAFSDVEFSPDLLQRWSLYFFNVDLYFLVFFVVVSHNIFSISDLPRVQFSGRWHLWRQWYDWQTIQWVVSLFQRLVCYYLFSRFPVTV